MTTTNTALDFLDQIGAKRDSIEFTIRELRAAFNRVAPSPNWKATIDSTIEIKDAREMALIREAVPFMTGSIPVITPAGDKFRVEADGYWADIGA